MARERPLHCTVPDDHPGIIEGSVFRPVLCDSRAVYLSERKRKKPRPKPRFDDRVVLGFDYGADSQAYYTDDFTRVTCKLCLHKLGKRVNSSPVVFESDETCTSMSTRKIGRALVFLRKSKSVNQLKFATAVGWNRSTLIDIEKGRAKTMSLRKLERAANYFGLKLSEFIASIENNTYMFKKHCNRNDPNSPPA